MPAFVTIDAAGVRTVHPDPRPLDEQKADALAQVASTRWTRQQTMAFAGVVVASDDIAVGRVTGAIAALQLKGGGSIQWKTGPGEYVTLDLAGLQALGQAMFDHVQACFAHEAALAGQIAAAADAEALDMVDLYAGWPTAPTD